VKHKGATYQLAQYHFHWAKQYDQGGSEHTYNGKQFFAEVHFVHYNKKYANLGAAVAQSDGLLVWGHFIQAKNDTADHADYGTLLAGFSKAQHQGASGTIDYIPPMKLIPPNSKEYYTYPGSLTTPRCYESVTWIVNRDVIDISPAQAAIFSTVYKNKQGEPNKSMYDNFRPPQDLNGRVVEKNFGGPSSAWSITASFTTLIIALVMFYVL